MFELYIEPERPKQRSGGRYKKGHIPHNKGKKWGDYMTKRGIKRASKGWENVVKYRPKERSPKAGIPKRQVIAVLDDGSWLHFSSVAAAGRWIGGNRANTQRCCVLNEVKHVSLHDGTVNTDHKYNGVRFYYEDDNVWTTKIKR